MSPSPNTIPGVILKLRRAHTYLQELEVLASSLVQANHYSTSSERDPKDTAYLVLKARVDDISPEPLSLVIGDVLHNLRSSLDHLAYALAAKFTNPLPDDVAQDSQFPIVGDRNKKSVEGQGPAMFKLQARHIRCIHPDAQAIIEWLQPYHRGQDYATHPLWRLAELSNIDKHRLVHLGVAFSKGLLMDIDPLRDNCVVGPGTIEVLGGMIDGETVIARIPARVADPSRRIQMNFRPALHVAFSDGIASGENVTATLAAIYNFILAVVLPPLEPFL